MFKLVLEKAEEPEIKLPTSAGSSKKQEEFQKNIYFCFIDYAKAFDCVDHDKLWKILKKMGISDHLTCLLRNLYAGQEAIVRTGHGPTDWFQTGKGVCQGCILSACLFNFSIQSTSCEMLGWMKLKLESRLPGEISITSDMQMTPPLWIFCVVFFFFLLLSKSKCLLISWLQSSSAVILEPRKIKSATISTVSPSICHELMGLDTMILVF